LGTDTGVLTKLLTAYQEAADVYGIIHRILNRYRNGRLSAAVRARLARRRQELTRIMTKVNAVTGTGLTVYMRNNARQNQRLAVSFVALAELYQKIFQGVTQVSALRARAQMNGSPNGGAAAMVGVRRNQQNAGRVFAVIRGILNAGSGGRPQTFANLQQRLARMTRQRNQARGRAQTRARTITQLRAQLARCATRTTALQRLANQRRAAIQTLNRTITTLRRTLRSLQGGNRNNNNNRGRRPANNRGRQPARAPAAPPATPRNVDNNSWDEDEGEDDEGW